MLFDVSQIVFPDSESFPDNFLAILRSGHKSILESLVIQQINVYVVASSSFWVDSSLCQSFTSLYFGLIQLNNDTWVCIHSSQMIQLTLIYWESFEDKTVHSAIWLSKSLLDKLVNYRFRHEVTFLKA